MSADLGLCKHERKTLITPSTAGYPYIYCLDCSTTLLTQEEAKRLLPSPTPTDAEERGRLKGLEEAANLMDRLSQGSVEGGLLERGVGMVLRSAGGQLAKHIRALAGKTEKEPTS